jgi:hypothetical protein
MRNQGLKTQVPGGGLHGAAAPGRDGQRRRVAACRTARLGAHRADRRLRLEHCRSAAGRYAQTAAAAAISTGGLSSFNVPDVVHSEHFRVVTPISARSEPAPIVKLVHNCTSAVMGVALAEVFVMGVKAGVDPVDLWEAVRQGATGWVRTFVSRP